ncbi:MAG: AraC family transcriptional regulator [Planctomycetales bacterium]|nr:AraC family transcriptional regulator [Planctomycetales bacterium]
MIDHPGLRESKLRTSGDTPADNLSINSPLMADAGSDVDLRLRLAGRIADPFVSEQLFDHLTDIVYFVKDELARYVVVNQTLVERAGATSKTEVVGKTSLELFGGMIGERFYAQDMAVLQTREPLINDLEKHAYSPRGEGWCLTTKLPLVDAVGNVVGLVGISRDIQSLGDESNDLTQLAGIVEYIKQHLADPLRTTELAEQTGMSAYQLDRRCREVYGVTTSQLILQLRMGAAACQLRQSNESILAIALSSGYSDQSAFTRQFRRTFGVSPGKYRR